MNKANAAARQAAGQRAGAALQRSGNSLIDELLEGWSAEDRSDLVRLLARFELDSNRVAATLRDTQDTPTCP